ncbi:16S rRNA (cytosine(967)-C(5))-methyltransferase [Alkalinema sp. FACHB-956]|uniref:16S rRNA (cytosine(967)-C(5))-methyltransferase n=1 Tax=Alkalinema sp. FACHB-956 TaxID=2692768 RepID=UPI001682DAA5|nr:16S rRNA (cytosine(967)-C(5))-methyltransferase [Alkalinema sp. FACHB-956]
MSNARQLALLALKQVHQQSAYADFAIDRCLSRNPLDDRDRRLFTELVYGIVRRQRTLDAIIDRLAKKSATQQPLDLRLILQLGLYQLLFLQQIPVSATIHSTVELAKANRFSGLAGFVNALLRESHRIIQAHDSDPIAGLLPELKQDPTSLGIRHSYPDWIIQIYLDQFGWDATQALCEWMNRPPHLDLRVNTLSTSLNTLATAMATVGIHTSRVPPLPQCLRLSQRSGAIQDLPGFAEGGWIVQDASAQLVSYLVDPQPDEVIVDACAAPGGKTLHLAELMHDRGVVYACDRTASRLKKLQQNLDRLNLHNVKIVEGDARSFTQFAHQCDRVLVDAPCSGLGTLHRHADARWRQTPESVQQLAQLQQEILTQAATWVKPGGVLVYSTCTLHPQENEQVVETFLANHRSWAIAPPSPENPAFAFADAAGWVKVLPHEQDMDGFFMVRLQQQPQ